MDAFDFVNRANADYVDQLYQQYLKDPREVEPQWQAFFAGFDMGTSKAAGVTPGSAGQAAVQQAAGTTANEVLQIEIADLVHSYRELGHYIATLDPLGHHRPAHPLLELSEFGLSMADLDRQVGADGFLHATDGTLRDLLEKLREAYCANFGAEYMSISDKTQREWLQQRMEPNLNRPPCGADECKNLLKQIVDSQGFEEFLGTKYVGQKRFSLEGAEALIPLLNAIVEDGADLGAEEMIFGMAHRGRLNVLANVIEKPFELILSEFEGTGYKAEEGDGDVKYHQGYSKDRVTKSGKRVHLALSFNPSHLELVNPVVEGIVRAKQYYLGDNERTRVVPILIHGDAAFVGQGIVQETLSLSEMPYWRTGGTIHVIVNNQIGFTTMPKQGRFTPYPSDVAKMIQAPVFHVNGDDPEACAHAARLAIAFRQKFHQDVIIDMWCYRRHGHNEADEPSFTQPLMYKEIDAHARPREVYSKRLVDSGRVTADEFEKMKTDLRQKLDAAQVVAKEPTPRNGAAMSMGGVWQGLQRHGEMSVRTAISPETIRKVGAAATNPPADFNVHPKLKRLLQSRREMSEGKASVDWGTAEMFALGSMVLEGTPVRFVGQDVQRGTFSHRHACLHDYENGKKWYPLAGITPEQAPIIFVNTMLSELAVLGFEYGFSSADPRNLVIWEAQFGDFVNGAQAIIDQFIAAGESKWQKMCGLVMLLPHGYEGAGPEHSNAYLERWLQLCAEENMQVIYPSMPAQYFHALRRQMKRNFRKPLIAMMPKYLLRSEQSASTLDEFVNGSFQLVIDDPANPPRERVKRLVLCSGKVYFLLNAERIKQKIEDVAIVRVEQLYPFPQKEVQAILAKYRNAGEICWVQEEPRNRGAWDFMRDQLSGMLPETAVLTYCGRDEAASPATGAKKTSDLEEKELVGHALDLSPAERLKDSGVSRVPVAEVAPRRRVVASAQK
ncbi:MAG TPA: 2-oxoglutarate dehydrogenase E1 component [Tepidisphaeraceae bacterium]|jgi:2-oxoglutarate dehydrogenase E1 component|nr:2-oxoglutarate dehydrogenase E1 component [Tepidisphaeraceae bacterium]